jgi:hypothetical protein
MKNLLVIILQTLLLFPLTLHASGCSTTAGGVPVVIPAPMGEFVEVGTDKLDFFEYMVPSGNRLLCAFVPTGLLPSLKKPASGMDRYMVVEISRRLDEKNAEVTSARFEEVVSGIKQKFGDSKALNQITQTTSEEIRRKLKAIDKSKDLAIEQPAPLGTLFQSPDAYAFAMISPVTSGGVSVRMINASVLLRVRNRLVFAYLYAGSDDETSLKWIENTAEDWARKILATNK